MPRPIINLTDWLPQPGWRRVLVGCLAFVFLVGVVYWPIVPGNFIMDDHRLVKEDNPLVNGQLTPATLWFQTDFPLSTLGFWWQWKAFGENPAGYHLVNMILHALGATLLWRVLAGLKIPGAWLAAALFAAHPVCVNSVARISEFKNTLSLPFFLLSLLLYLPDIIDNKKTRPCWWYIGSLVAFILAALSKTSTIMLPVVFLLCVWWARRRVSLENVCRAAPFFLLAVVFGAMSSWFQRHQAMNGPLLQSEPFAARLAMSGRIFWFYLGKAWLPVNLNLVCSAWKPGWLPDILLAAASAVCVCFRRTWGRPVLFGLGVYVVLLFPVLGFFDSQFLTKWRVSDHLQYLPLVAPLALAAGIFVTVLPARMVEAGAALLILALSILTIHRAEIFTSEERLFRDTLAKNPSAWGIQNDLGVVLARRGELPEAEELLRASLATKPHNADAESNLGRVLMEERNTSEARIHFQKALQLDPRHLATHRLMAALDSGNSREAQFHLRAVLALSTGPEIKTRLDYANALHLTGDLKQSAAILKSVLALQPACVEALNNLAWLLATAPDDSLRDGHKAIEYALKASQLPAPPGLCVPGTLAAAYAEAGRFPEAIAAAEMAIQSEKLKGNARFVAMNQQLLEIYRSGHPFREPAFPQNSR